MKHLLNNLTEEEKDSIREQHTDSIEVNTSRFKTLIESSLGNVKPLLNEQETEGEEETKPYENPMYANAGYQKVNEINLPDGEYIANPIPEVRQISDWANLKYTQNLFLFTKEKKYTGYILVLKMASRSGEDNQPITISGKKAILGDNEPRCCLSYYFKQPVAQTGTTVNEQVSSGTTQPTKIIEITDQSVIPQSLIDNPPIPGTFDHNKGTYDDKGQYMDISDTNGTTYRIRNWGSMNFAGHSTQGKVTSEYNSLLANTQDIGGKPAEAYFNQEAKTGSEIVPNNKNKWIGFKSSDKTINFACFTDTSGKITCKEYIWRLKTITR